MKYLPFALGIVEIAIFLALVSWIGLGWTLGLLVLDTLIGLLLFRREGLRVWRTYRRAAAGNAPDTEAVAAAQEQLAGTGSRMLAAGLLIVPGFLTDVVGALLFVPPVRRSIGQRIAASTFGNYPQRRTPQRPPDGSVIQGEVVNPVDPDDLDGT